MNTVDHGRWESNTRTIYIETQNPTFVLAYQTAIANWNATGAFTFVVTTDPSQADIIATEMNVGNTQAAGEANSTTNLLTNYYSSVTVRLNSYYLLNEQYGYDMDRIVHTAEHELGHTIGLDHKIIKPLSWSQRVPIMVFSRQILMQLSSFILRID